MNSFVGWSIGIAFAAGLAFAAGSYVGLPKNASAQEDCDPSYPSICVRPSEGDYDCAGSGDGPNYVVGPVEVLPPDPLGLDPDGDGIGCEEGEVSAPDGQDNSTDPTATAATGAATATPVAGGSTTPATPTSDVEAISVAGFGPDDAAPGGPYAWLIAGLTGAGIAWVLSALAASRLAFARSGDSGSSAPSERSPAEQAPLFVKMRPVRSSRDEELPRPKTARIAEPPILPPPPFRRSGR